MICRLVSLKRLGNVFLLSLVSILIPACFSGESATSGDAGEKELSGDPVGSPYTCFESYLMDWEELALVICRHYYDQCEFGIDRYDYFACLLDKYGHDTEYAGLYCRDIEALIICEIDVCQLLESCTSDIDCIWNCVYSECGFGPG